jgi:hypothetical protein
VPRRPGAWTTWAGTLGLGPSLCRRRGAEASRPRPESPARTPRVPVATVGCGTARSRLGEVRPPGKRRWPLDAWARGMRDLDGARSADGGQATDPARRPRRTRPAAPAAARRAAAGSPSTCCAPSTSATPTPTCDARAARARGRCTARRGVRHRARLRHAARAAAPTTRCSPACVDRPLDAVDAAVLDVLPLGRPPAAGDAGCRSHAAVGRTVELARAVLGEAAPVRQRCAPAGVRR